MDRKGAEEGGGDDGSKIQKAVSDGSYENISKHKACTQGRKKTERKLQEKLDQGAGTGKK